MQYEIKACKDGDADLIWEKAFRQYAALAPIGQGAEEAFFVWKLTDGSGRIVGGCVLNVDPLKNAELERLWVNEPYRRQGLGVALLRMAERSAWESGCHVLISDYSFDFQGVRPLFEKLGYRLLGSSPWPKGRESDCFVKQLDAAPAETGCEASLARPGLRLSPGSEEDKDFLTDRLEAYNSRFAPRRHPYWDLDQKAVNAADEMIAGCIAGVSGWDTLHIDEFWVDEPYWEQGIAAPLLRAVEQAARQNGAYLARLRASDREAVFFREQGYTDYVIHVCNPKLHLMQKLL